MTTHLHVSFTSIFLVKDFMTNRLEDVVKHHVGGRNNSALGVGGIMGKICVLESSFKRQTEGNSIINVPRFPCPS